MRHLLRAVSFALLATTPGLGCVENRSLKMVDGGNAPAVDIATDRAGGVDRTVADEWVEAPDAPDAKDSLAESLCLSGPGCLLDPCELDSDCQSGFCIDTSDGRQCTTECDSTCPLGWKCGLHQPSQPMLVHICSPAHLTLCKPCLDNTGCPANGVLLDEGCIPYGPGGNFCGSACSTPEDCPEKYACEELPDVSGDITGRCVTEALECQCQPWFGDEPTTTCYIQNDFGACKGTRSCESGELAQCSAAVPAQEECDGIDNDCDGQTDSGYDDTDRDAWADCVDPDDDNDSDPDGLDCRPLDPAVSHFAAEACDGQDNDCDGATDEGFPDFEADGIADCVDADDDNDGDPDLSDCHSGDPEVHHGAEETCDAIDNNCNGLVDEGYADSDGDQLADCQDSDDDNDGEPDQLDCGPLEPSVNHQAIEVCDGLDNNCDGEADEGFPDADADELADCVDDDDDNDGDPDGNDCEPTDQSVHHGALESCDGVDNDCDMKVDEPYSAGCIVYYEDKDDDGWGVGGNTTCLCEADDPYGATVGGDCDDTAWAVHPGGTEVCNGADDECDGEADNPGASGCLLWYADGDGDGYGAASQCLCTPSEEYDTPSGGDCDDGDPAIYPGASELCDEKDNDCDGLIDQGLDTNCGECDPTCHQVDIAPGGTEEFDPTPDNSSGVLQDDNGFLTLVSEEVELALLWVANSGESTVSKLDTRTGHELARYHVCANPSRTAMDLYSNAWVACRSDGGVARIMTYEHDCVDKNQDGTIQTSKDLDGNHEISAGEMLPKGQDECVKFITYPGGSCQRAAGVDADNNVWIGEWNGQILRKLSPDQGSVMQTISIGCNPYGLVIDGDGIIWVSGRGCSKLVRVDPATGQWQHIDPPSGNLYGITVDNAGRIWLGHYSNYGVSRYDPESETWEWITDGIGQHCPRGVAASSEGYVYFGLGCAGDHHLAEVNQETLEVNLIDLGGDDRMSIGVAIDADGHAWAMNYKTDSATKVDPVTDTVVGDYPVGSSPYTYSDMAGYAVKNYTAPEGFYRHVIPGGPAGGTDWVSLELEVTFQGNSNLLVKVRTADTVLDLPSSDWQGPFGPFPPNALPLDLTPVSGMSGKYLEIEVQLVADEEGKSPLVKSIKAQYQTQQ